MGKNVDRAKRGANRRPSGARVQGKIEKAIPAGQRNIGGARAGTALGTARNMQPSGNMRGNAAGKIAGFNRSLWATRRTRTGIDMQYRISRIIDQAIHLHRRRTFHHQHSPWRDPDRSG